jgi:ATP-binding cassette subfamily B protein
MLKKYPKTLFKFILHFLKDHQLAIGLIIFCGLISGTYSTINAYLLKVIIDNVSHVTDPSSGLWRILFYPALFFVLNHEVHNLSWRVIQFINIKLGPRVENQITQEMFAYTEKNSFRYFQDNFAGTISNNISILANNTFEIITNVFPFLIRQSFQILLTLVIMFTVNPLFAYTFLVWVISFIVINLYYTQKITKLSNVLAKSHSVLSGKIIDSISASSSVRLFARESFEVHYLKKYLNNVANKFANKEWFSLKLSAFQGISISLFIAVLVFGLIHLRSHHLVSVGDFALILSLGLYVAEGVWYLMEQIHRLNDLVGRCNQSLAMLLIPHEIVDTPNAKELIISKGKIEFDNVSFHYKKENALFNNQSIIIPGGQRVGLVGFSGSGKTTFVNLIIRLFDLSSGEIRIDGQNIQHVTQDSLRENIGFIPQDPILFHRSLLENIRYGNIDASDEEVIIAAKKAHAHEFITLTSNGYHSLVGERGIKLSGGQRQRIAIARAILKNAPILILDEATSALDSVTEGYIQESLSLLMKDKTVIVIAHRLSTLLEMDRILVFDQGKIIEEGAHFDLIKQDGMYSLLWKKQVGGFLLDKITD